ncbi:MAG: ABC transporter substrate-binding protein [Syntrophobacteria bacterium]
MLSAAVAVVWLQALPAVAEETIKVGIFLPMTGPMADYGRSEWEGITAAHDMSSMLSGRKIKLFLEDTRSDNIRAARAVRRLIKEHNVVGVLGGASNATALVGGFIAEESKVPMISPSATSSLVTCRKRYVFRACFDDSVQGRAAAIVARDTMNAKTAAVVVDIAQEDYCVELANLFVKAFGELGSRVLCSTYIQTGDQDFRRQLSEVLSADPDVIYLPNYYRENALIARQARDLGIMVPILMADRAQVSQLIEIGGQAVEKVYLTGHFNVEAVTTKLGKDYVAYYRKKYNKEPDAFGALGADAYFILIDAIKRAGCTEGAELRKALVKTNDFQGVSGTITLGPDGNTVKGVVINKVEGGEFTYVTSVSP